MVAILAWVVWGTCAFILLCQIPIMFDRDPGKRLMAGSFAVIGSLGLAATLFYGVSKFHMLWWLPVSLLLTLLITQMYVARETRALFQKRFDE